MELAGQMDERFHVWQFFEDGTYERVRDSVLVEEAAIAFRHYSTSVAARVGLTKRIIVTDSGDVICAEWIYGQGIVFPPQKEDPS